MEEEFKDVPGKYYIIYLLKNHSTLNKFLDETAGPINKQGTHNFDYFQYDYNKFMSQKNTFYQGNDDVRTLLEDVSRNNDSEIDRVTESAPNQESSTSTPRRVANKPKPKGNRIVERLMDLDIISAPEDYDRKFSSN